VKRWFWIWGPAVAQMAIIFAISSLHQVTLPEGVSDKTGHFAGYAILGAALIRALASARWARVGAGVALAALLLSSAYGASDEFHQSFVPGRTADVHDWVADTLGAAASVAVAFLWARLRIARGGPGRSV
jgi:VanZ family protein